MNEPIFPNGKPPIVLTIAGSDSSGGAGIQADLKTIAALGGYGASAITAITVQNTLGVQQVFPLPADLLLNQIYAVMDDLVPQVVKIGMVYNREQVEVIAKNLRHFSCKHVVYDPVMVSTSGRKLMADDTIEYLCDELLPRCTLITPNLQEASILWGKQVYSPDLMEEAGRDLANRYGCRVLVKGGHLVGHEMLDMLCSADSAHPFSSVKTESSNLHGTGCTLSSAIATLLARDVPMVLAVKEAKRYVSYAIQAAAALHIGSGNGPLWHQGFKLEL